MASHSPKSIKLKPKGKHQRHKEEYSEVQIEVDPYSTKPTEAWFEHLSLKSRREQLPEDFYSRNPVPENCLRFVCMSDTHR